MLVNLSTEVPFDIIQTSHAVLATNEMATMTM